MFFSSVLVLLLVSQALAQKTLKEYCLEYYDSNPLWGAILDKDQSLEYKIIVLLYDMYSKTTVRCFECIPYIFVSFSAMIIAGLTGIIFIVLRESKQIIRYFLLKNVDRRIQEIERIRGLK